MGELKEEAQRVESCYEEILDVLEKYDCKLAQRFQVVDMMCQSVYTVVRIEPVPDILTSSYRRKDRWTPGMKVYG